MSTTSSQDKNNILSNTNNGEDIYLYYLKLPELPKKNISSPFAKDSNPSFNIYKQSGTIKFKCHSTGKTGDVFQFVADLKNLDTKTQFSEILKTIQNDMFLSDKENTIPKANSVAKKTANPLQILEKEEKKVKIDIQTTEFTENHLLFWKGIGVQKELLDKYKVKAVAKYSFFSKRQNKKFYFDRTNCLAFSYEVNGNYEVYTPNQPERNVKKGFCNGLTSNDIFGLEQLPKEKIENLIICAGKKDTIVAVSRGFYAVTFQSEAKNPTKEQINALQNHCNNLFICYDNDQGGQKGTKRITETFPNIIPIDFPIEYNDITDYFQEKSKDDFENLIEIALEKSVANSVEKVATALQDKSKKETTTVFHITEDYITQNYDIRFNTISIDIEISPKDKNEWEPINENSLWLELRKQSINIPMTSLIAILKSSFATPYNPILSYFESLPQWDNETDYIKKFCDYVVLDPDEDREQFEYHFKKWCVRAVKCSTDKDYFNKQAFILTDNGLGQNIGKSSWCRFLCPPELKNYIAEDIKEDKDSRILLCKNFLINLDELAALTKKEINHLKSYFSKDSINERLPYERKNSVIPRIASFIGSTNMSTFLQDETGSVRWLCFVVKQIIWDYKKEFNIDNLWSQAYALSNDKNFNPDLTRLDIEKNEIRNEKFQIIPPERDLIREYFRKPDPTQYENSEFLTATEILSYINQSQIVKANSITIGKQLTYLKFERVKHNGVYGYWVVKQK